MEKRDVTALPLCSCGHPASGHYPAGTVDGGRCQHAVYGRVVEQCPCEAFTPSNSSALNSRRSRWWCFFGLHDWRTIHVERWGAVRWHTWEIGQECAVCGDYRDYHETNARMVEERQAELEAS